MASLFQPERSLFAFALGLFACGDTEDTPASDPRPSANVDEPAPATTPRQSSRRPLTLPLPPQPPTPHRPGFFGTPLGEHEDEQPALSLLELEVTREDGSTRPSLGLRARARIHQDIDHASYVQAKAVCRARQRWLADTGYVNSDQAHPLADLEPGDVVSLTGSLFSQGLDPEHGACELEFRLAGSTTPAHVPLATACWSEGETTSGRCNPPLQPVASTGTEGSLAPMLAHDLGVREPEDFATRGSLTADYVLELLEPRHASARVTLKAACTVDDTRFVAVVPTHLTTGPFEYARGESVYRTASLFYEPMYGFARAPSPCNLELALWTRPDPRHSQYDKLVLLRGCYVDDEVSSTPCPTPPPAYAPMGESLRLGNTDIQVVEPYGYKGKRYQLKILADVTLLGAVDQFTSITAHVTCRVGESARVDTAYLQGIDLFYLEPGETARLTSTAFNSNGIEDEPINCEASFTAGRRFAPIGAANVDLGHTCYRRGRTQPGKC